MSQFDFKQRKTELRKLISDISEKPLEEIKDDSRFAEDIDIDRMMALEVVASIEKKYLIKSKNVFKSFFNDG